MKMKKTLIAAAGVLLCAFAGPAFADAAGAASCAAGLNADAKTIYDATAPNVTAGADLRALITTQTKSLVMNGTIGRGGAKTAAEAAGACLAMLP
jgi:hypothetical protein